jgi:hypothetical protein
LKNEIHHRYLIQLAVAPLMEMVLMEAKQYLQKDPMASLILVKFQKDPMTAPALLKNFLHGPSALEGE